MFEWQNVRFCDTIKNGGQSLHFCQYFAFSHNEKYSPYFWYFLLFFYALNGKSLPLPHIKFPKNPSQFLVKIRTNLIKIYRFLTIICNNPPIILNYPAALQDPLNLFAEYRKDDLTRPGPCVIVNTSK